MWITCQALVSFCTRVPAHSNPAANPPTANALIVREALHDAMLFNLSAASAVILCPLDVLEAGLDAVGSDEFDVSFADCGKEGG